MKKNFVILSIAILITLMSAFLDSTEVNNSQEYKQYLQQAVNGELVYGYPFPYIKMHASDLTPPFPYTFLFEYENAGEVLMGAFFLNTIIYFALLWLLVVLFKAINRFLPK
ncbi:hypothetical protein N780_05770 [Pontibacillus chungwhensis BH030062]|uniref:DUF4306 domain-containing protein n=1 Tax=Pontibacillus chungwhensis BH030062 TaxID=1385513 RepID=A0A0A2UU68_9BACI|nr:hypothetical protein [Pontibacillus chungwhensis]KGP90288.1 hypothetical protein N780_05770 [Pontibacillus chungwhensis BH030062]